MASFNTATFSYREGSPYNGNDYANFESMGGAYLLLYQVMIEANWSETTFDMAYKFNNLLKSVSYFDSFHIIIVLVLISVIKGIVWDVFSTVDSEFNKLNEA